MLGLADGGQNGISAVPAAVKLRLVNGCLGFGVCPVALVFGQLYAGFFTQAQALTHVVDGSDADAVADLVEEVVTGIAKRLGCVDTAVRIAVRKSQAGNFEVIILIVGAAVFIECAVVIKLGFGVDDMLVHTGNDHGHLVSGAGGIGGDQRAVVQRFVGVFGQGFVIVEEGGQIVGGIAGAGQNLAGFDIQCHSRAAFCVPAVFVRMGTQIFNNIGQCLLGNFLQANINGDFYVGAGLRLCFKVGTDQRAVFGRDVDTPAVDTVQVFFIGGLQAVLTNLGIHVVAVNGRVVFPLFGAHGANVTQNVSSIVGAVFPDGGGFHVDARYAHFHDRCNGFITGVSNEDV